MDGIRHQLRFHGKGELNSGEANSAYAHFIFSVAAAAKPGSSNNLLKLACPMPNDRRADRLPDMRNATMRSERAGNRSESSRPAAAMPPSETGCGEIANSTSPCSG